MSRFISLAVSTGVKIMVLYLLLGAGLTLTNGWVAATRAIPGSAEPWTYSIAASAVLLLMVCWNVPKFSYFKTRDELLLCIVRDINRKLRDLCLVRPIEQYYEIIHDFIARRVVSELVASEEKEFKRFQELLNSKAAAFATTGALLDKPGNAHAVQHRERVIPGELELHLLLLSWLKGEGPALYWLLAHSEDKFPYQLDDARITARR